MANVRKGKSINIITTLRKINKIMHRCRMFALRIFQTYFKDGLIKRINTHIKFPVFVFVIMRYIYFRVWVILSVTFDVISHQKVLF